MHIISSLLHWQVEELSCKLRVFHPRGNYPYSIPWFINWKIKEFLLVLVVSWQDVMKLISKQPHELRAERSFSSSVSFTAPSCVEISRLTITGKSFADDTVRFIGHNMKCVSICMN